MGAIICLALLRKLTTVIDLVCLYDAEATMYDSINTIFLHTTNYYSLMYCSKDLIIILSCRQTRKLCREITTRVCEQNYILPPTTYSHSCLCIIQIPYKLQSHVMCQNWFSCSKSGPSMTTLIAVIPCQCIGRTLQV